MKIVRAVDFGPYFYWNGSSHGDIEMGFSAIMIDSLAKKGYNVFHVAYRHENVIRAIQRDTWGY